MEKEERDRVMIERPKGIGIRHRQVGLLFLGIVSLFIIRADISVAIVAMTRNTTNESTYEETFDWDEPTKGWILSSFLWGFVALQFHAGFATQKFGAKYFLLLSVLLSAILTMLIPMFGHFGWAYVCAIRTLIGLSQAFAFPSCNSFLAKWIHPSERGLSSIVLTGNSFGIFVIIVISGFIAESPLRWPGIFYVSGGIGLVWSLAWIWCACELPSQHRTISDHERLYLEAGYGAKFVKQNKKLPWKDIFQSPPFLAAIIAIACQNWGYFALLMEVPSYMTESLNYNIKSSAIMAGSPYLAMLIMVIVMAFLSDFLINRQFVSRTTSRKIFNSIGLLVPMVCMIGMGFVTKETAHVAAVLLLISTGCNAGVHVGVFINAMDLAPNFAGALSGILFSFGMVPALLAPIFVGTVVTDATDASQWRIVFFVTAALYFLGSSVFIIFGQGTVQHWNETKSRVESKSDIRL